MAQPKVPFPEIKDWTTLKISLKRTQCYGPCPSYSVEVKGTGEVTYFGTGNVLVAGQHHAKLAKSSVEALFAAFRQANYFSLKDDYSMFVTDNPTYKTSIEFDGQKKSVLDYVGWRAGMPEDSDQPGGFHRQNRRHREMDQRQRRNRAVSRRRKMELQS